MKTILELAPKPSDAIQAMIDGLKEQDERPDFKVRMDTFLSIGTHYGTPICYGCAATCALQKLTGYNITPSTFLGQSGSIKLIEQYSKMPIPVEMQTSVWDFEAAIDQFRQGNYYSILNFYDIDAHDWPETSISWDMDTGNWKEELPKVEEYVKQLREAGL